VLVVQDEQGLWEALLGRRLGTHDTPAQPPLQSAVTTDDVGACVQVGHAE